MTRLFLLVSSVALFPSLTYAATGNGLQKLFTNLLTFIDKTLIPFILGLAFLFFIINVVRYFIFEGATEEGREKAKNLALYSVLAFVFILTFWGIVNMLTSSTGLEGQKSPQFDYVEENPSGSSPSRASAPSPAPSGPATPPSSPSAVVPSPRQETPTPTQECPWGSTWSAAEGSCQSMY
jgi:succinate dehydrogenase/fumarate reductase cytochrome b subunit